MTIINNDFSTAPRGMKTLVLEDFADDKFELVQYTEGIDPDGFNVDVNVREGEDICTVTLSREDAEALLAALASILINTPVGE